MESTGKGEDERRVMGFQGGGGGGGDGGGDDGEGRMYSDENDVSTSFSAPICPSLLGERATNSGGKATHSASRSDILPYVRLSK